MTKVEKDESYATAYQQVEPTFELKVESESQIKPRKMTGFILIFTVGVALALLVVRNDYLNSTEYKATQLENFGTAYQLDQCQDYTGTHKMDKSHCCSNPDFAVLGGIDVVNLFSQHEDTLPVVGKDEFSATLETANGEFTFLFVNEENRGLFEADPWKYAPAYGGFDSCGVSLEERAKIPENAGQLGPPVDLSKWAVVNDRLYFFAGVNPKEHFLAETAAIELGDSNWKSYFDGSLQEGIFNTNCFRRQTYFDLLMGKESLYTCRDNHTPRKLYDDTEENDRNQEDTMTYQSHIGSAREGLPGSASSEEGRRYQGAQSQYSGNALATNSEGRSRQGLMQDLTEDTVDAGELIDDHLKELVGMDLTKLSGQIRKARADITAQIQEENQMSQEEADYLAEQVLVETLKIEVQDLQSLLLKQAADEKSSSSSLEEASEPASESSSSSEEGMVPRSQQTASSGVPGSASVLNNYGGPRQSASAAASGAASGASSVAGAGPRSQGMASESAIAGTSGSAGDASESGGTPGMRGAGGQGRQGTGSEAGQGMRQNQGSGVCGC